MRPTGSKAYYALKPWRTGAGSGEFGDICEISPLVFPARMAGLFAQTMA